MKRLDHLLAKEADAYKTQRRVSFSGWPTLDPLKHPSDPNRYEDTVSIDIAHMDLSKAPAGYFAGYHAYPYYPDFVSHDPAYQSAADYPGQNSCLGYLTALKKHYKGVAHYAQSGMHHGGMDEETQGKNNLRMLSNIEAAGGGGIQFSLLDEWFKRTWITDQMDSDPDRRILRHNVTAAEQNFGLIGFKKSGPAVQPWQSFCAECPVSAIEAGADYAFLNLRLKIKKPLAVLDTPWVALVTYDATLGESRLPNGKRIANRAEFVLVVTHYKAELYVTEAYDPYGIWHGNASPKQLFRSVATDGAPWRVVRWRNNNNDQEVQYIGSLRINRLGLPATSMDAVYLKDDAIAIKLPWTLLNVTEPSTAAVMHDDPFLAGRQHITSDGMAATVFHEGGVFETSSRFKWEGWNNALGAVEYKKASYEITKERKRAMLGNPISYQDSYAVQQGQLNEVKAGNGVLINDLSLDGSAMEAVLETGPAYGQLILYADGGFIYVPEEGRTGAFSFTYRVLAGGHRSESVMVQLLVEGTPLGDGFARLYPNPTQRLVHIDAKAVIDRAELYNHVGTLLFTMAVNAKEAQFALDKYPSGLYMVKLYSGRESIARKVVLVR